MSRDPATRLLAALILSTAVHPSLLQPQGALWLPAETRDNPPAALKGLHGCSRRATFVGEVRRGEDFERNIAASLLFRLRASHDPAIEGWTIEIHPQKPWADGSSPDYAWVLNPPFHYYNTTCVDVSYDFSAEMAVHFGPRQFRFPLDEAGVTRAGELVGIMTSHTGPESDAALKEFNEMPSGQGIFEILRSRLGPSGPENGRRGRIEWLKFRLTIILPCTLPAQARKPQSISSP